ncbi:MAG: ABC transporter permease [Lachnospiraceae bacterium]
MLARERNRSNRGQNRLLVFAVAFSVFSLFSIFSLATGKIESDYLLYARGSGTVASTTLKHATQKQYEQIKKLSYIKETGKEVEVGTEKSNMFIGKVLDATAYEKMQMPAYTDIHGEYPKKEKEIMLATRTLHAMKIQKPKVGMKIPIELTLVNGEEITKTFLLSGYYTEYMDPLETIPDGYFSEEFLITNKISREDHTTLFIQQEEHMSGDDIEDLLYRDVPMRDETQQFIGGNSIMYQAMFDFSGGYDTAIFSAVLILSVAYLLIYNILQISMNRDIRQFGLLKTLGMTKIQLKKMVYRQIGIITAFGCLFGSIGGCLVTIGIIPKILSGMYLYGLGNASNMIAFRWWILAGSMVFGGSVPFLAGAVAIKKMVKMSPIEAAKFDGKEKVGKKKQKKRTKGNSLSAMAWGNILRYKKRLFLTIGSLFISITVFLGTIVLVKGLDDTNRIEKEYFDFKIDANPGYNGVSNREDTVWDKMLNRKGVTKKEKVQGGYGMVSMSDETLSIRFASMNKEDHDGDKYPFTVQILSDAYLKRLQQFVQEKGLSVDVDAVRNGQGAIVMHYHNLSKIQENKSKETIGKPISIYRMNEKKVSTMPCCGYLDFTEKGLPKFESTWKGPDIVYFLVSDKGFRKMGLEKRTFGIRLDVAANQERMLKIQFNKMIEEHNKSYLMEEHESGYTNAGVISMLAKSDMLADSQNYIRSARIVMESICVILLFLAVINYANVTMTGLVVRKKEFAVLESIGMTRKQLRKMLVLEGIFYSLLVMILTATIGSGVLLLLGKLTKSRVGYFVFSYPIKEMLATGIIFMGICMIVPLTMYHRTTKESVVERLRYFTD